jgi:hypothetical protein
VALAEKAYAQLAEEGWSRADHGEFTNSYDAIGYGSSLTVMEQITGSTTGQQIQIYGDTKAQLSTAETEVLNALAQNELVNFGTINASLPNNGILPNGEQFDSDHAYTLQSYDTKTKLFTFINPYDDGAGSRIVQVTWAQLIDYGYAFEEVTPPAGESVNSVEINT